MLRIVHVAHLQIRQVLEVRGHVGGQHALDHHLADLEGTPQSEMIRAIKLNDSPYLLH